MTDYVKISKSEVPSNVRFDTPRRNQGQIVVVSYGGYGRSEHDVGDDYKRVTDLSDNSVEYYRLRKAEG